MFDEASHYFALEQCIFTEYIHSSKALTDVRGFYLAMSGHQTEHTQWQFSESDSPVRPSGSLAESADSVSVGPAYSGEGGTESSLSRPLWFIGFIGILATVGAPSRLWSKNRKYKPFWQRKL